MRALKFRVWDNDQNKFYYFDLTSIPLIVNLGAPVTQFIGLQDQNSNDIYEGDILHTQTLRNGKKLLYEVIYSHHFFTLVNVENRRSQSHNISNYMWLRGDIIGNIFQNPEM